MDHLVNKVEYLKTNVLFKYPMKLQNV